MRLLLSIGRAPDPLLEVGEEIGEVRPHVPIKLIFLDVLAHDLGFAATRAVETWIR